QNSLLVVLMLLLMLPLPPISTLFPYTTLFRSCFKFNFRTSAFLPEFVHMIAWNRSDMRQFGLRAKIIQRNRRQIVFQIHSAEHPRIDTVSAGKVNFLAFDRQLNTVFFFSYRVFAFFEFLL